MELGVRILSKDTFIIIWMLIFTRYCDGIRDVCQMSTISFKKITMLNSPKLIREEHKATKNKARFHVPLRFFILESKDTPRTAAGRILAELGASDQ